VPGAGVVERTHGWLNRYRGLLIRWAKKAENYLAFLHLACGIITWRATSLRPSYSVQMFDAQLHFGTNDAD